MGVHYLPIRTINHFQLDDSIAHQSDAVFEALAGHTPQDNGGHGLITGVLPR